MRAATAAVAAAIVSVLLSSHYLIEVGAFSTRTQSSFRGVGALSQRSYSITTPRTITTILRASNDKNNIDKGFNLLEVASKVVPQGNIVKLAKFGWKFVWLRFMTELAPRDKSTGDYARPVYGFGKKISLEANSEFPAQPNRYHLYLGNPCPWCHRVKLVIELLNLEPILSGVTTLVDNPEKASRGGWIFGDTDSKSMGQQPQTFFDLRELYDFLEPGYTGRCTAPLLVDWETQQIVSNESKDIVRMLPLLANCKKEENDTASMVALDRSKLDDSTLETIDETNDWMYTQINNGVYRCGFATSQSAYESASKDVKEGLDRLEIILTKQDFVSHPTLFTESDLMLLPTMLRYDGVYGPLFRAGGVNIRLECEYPHVFQWMKRCWNEIEGVPESIDLSDACESYYKQLFPLNPGGKVPSPPVTAQTLRLV